MNREEFQRRQQGIADALAAAGIVITPEERDHLEVADFGLRDFPKQGLGLITYVNTTRVCAKELVMLPGQTCPQHRHPPVAGGPGKEETFRVRRGLCTLYVDDGPATAEPACTPPGPHYQKLREVTLRPGEQFTLPPFTWHWFQAGPEGCVVSEFSTTSRDDADEWIDPDIRRIPIVEG
ncbi:MAG TPA: D-lyxose/D-mannose family sugar isomerase [Armatimonadota bacterium]|jgi:D-lyxose ketol-isomerase